MTEVLAPPPNNKMMTESVDKPERPRTKTRNLMREITVNT